MSPSPIVCDIQSPQPDGSATLVLGGKGHPELAVIMGWPETPNGTICSGFRLSYQGLEEIRTRIDAHIYALAVDKAYRTLTAPPKCEECKSCLDRPNCCLELGPDCPRHDALTRLEGVRKLRAHEELWRRGLLNFGEVIDPYVLGKDEREIRTCKIVCRHKLPAHPIASEPVKIQVWIAKGHKAPELLTETWATSGIVRSVLLEGKDRVADPPTYGFIVGWITRDGEQHATEIDPTPVPQISVQPMMVLRYRDWPVWGRS